MRAAVGLLAMVMAIDVSAQGQVKARSEAPAEDNSKLFRSPMVLEVPVPGMERLQGLDWQRTLIFSLPQLTGYECDGVILERVFLRVEGPDSKGKTRGELDVTMRVRGGVDKLATFDLKLTSREKTVGSGRFKRADAEEGKVLTRKVRFPLDTTLLVADPPVMLHLTITVDDNP